MFKHLEARRRFSRSLLLILLLTMPSTFGAFAGEADDGGVPNPTSEEVHPWDGDVLGFHERVTENLIELFRWLFAWES